MDEWETIERTTAYTCDGFDVVNETVALPDGLETEFDYLEEGESVVILPFTTAGDVVVIDEWRHAVRRVNHGLPAGSLEGAEEPASGVERELVEETGYRPGRVEHLTSVEPTNGFADAVFHYFLAEECAPTGEQSLDPDETIEVSTKPYDELLEAVRTGELRDGRSAFGICYFELFGRR